ncbi:DNA cytosine methyltransferase [Alteromonas mediterranea]|jgi:DNA (cytosine-5)-methyltransferase 1|uniref:DNA cytosine methyltransferase n=1 Tax=Alteromonas mediterranea TaxID=314275 RepID=UPI002FE15F22|tara:strand:- start:3388 stop:4323 length:936 start_codon:yes stop_codon:yes gene_type:complete
MPTVVSLFSGCGGSDIGLKQAGFQTIFANDVLPYAKDFYERNLNEGEFLLKDIQQINSFPSSDLLVGCYPCQGFSQGGARDADRKINYLYRDFARALNQIKPKAFVVENVSGMVRSNFAHLYRSQLYTFRRAGYKVTAQIINAADYGLPQERKRLFFVGIRSDFGVRYNFPEPTHGNNTSKPHASQREYIGDLPEWPEGEFYNLDFHWYYLSRDRYRGWDQPSKTIVSNARHVPLHPMSPKLVKLKHDVWRFREDKPARRLSYVEAARLQGFPKETVFPDTYGMNMRYTIIGNAVPPPIMKAIVENMPNIW